MTIHNLWHYLDTMGRIRHAIDSGAFAEMRAATARSGRSSDDRLAPVSRRRSLRLRRRSFRLSLERVRCIPYC